MGMENFQIFEIRAFLTETPRRNAHGSLQLNLVGFCWSRRQWQASLRAKFMGN